MAVATAGRTVEGVMLKSVESVSQTHDGAGGAEVAPLDLNLLMLYLQIVTSGSLSQASEHLQVPKATLSRKLRELERQIGAVLLKRGPHGLEMSEVGRALHLHCEKISAMACDASQIAAEMQSLVRGTMRISIPFGLGRTWVSEAICALALRYPELKLLIHVSNRWTDVTEEPYDIAIHIGRVPNENIPTRSLAQLPRGLYASPDYCQRRGEPREPTELPEHDCIVLENQLKDGLWCVREPKYVKAKIAPRITTTDIVLAREMALAGVGIAMLTNVICTRDVEAGRLRRILPHWQVPPVVICAMFPERRYVPVRIRTFIDLLAEALRKAHPDGL